MEKADPTFSIHHPFFKLRPFEKIGMTFLSAIFIFLGWKLEIA